MTPRRALSDTGINERAQRFLKALIERYIRDGEPVGSRTLARDSGLDLSPATIRNVMSDLEEMGLVASPHTSAGRIPTVSGYRLFVDSLLTLHPLNEGEVDQLRHQLEGEQSPTRILESASQLLSKLTHMAGVVMIPRRQYEAVRQVEFLPLSGRRVLAILVTEDEEIQNQIITIPREYSRSELEEIGNYLSRTFAGRTLYQIRETMLREMSEARDGMDRIMARAIEMAAQVVDPQAGVLADPPDYVIAGQTNLMDFGELADMKRLRQLYDAFTEKHEILQLMDACMKEEGVQIFIGEESGYHQLDHCSLVTSPYKVDDQVLGMLGVIGPTRMAYDRVIPIVDITAKLLGAALRHRP